MTAEELKTAVRAYADEHLPGWGCIGVSIRLGSVGSHVTETLIVLPIPVANQTEDRPQRASTPE